MSASTYSKSRNPGDLIDQEQLKAFAFYDPESGVFTRAIDWRGAKKGSVLGHVNTNGYLECWIYGTRYLMHRLAFLYMHGSHPKNEIDHADGDRANNRMANLRDVTSRENAKNMARSSRNTTGIPGAFLCKRSALWVVHITVNGKHVLVGKFQMKYEARRARKLAEEKYGYHENHGREKVARDFHNESLREIAREPGDEIVAPG